MPGGLQSFSQRALTGVRTDFVGRAAFSQQRQSCSVWRQKPCKAAHVHTISPGSVSSCARSLRGSSLLQQTVPVRRNNHLLSAAASDSAAPADDQPDNVVEAEHQPAKQNLKSKLLGIKSKVSGVASNLSPAKLVQQGKASLHIVDQSWQLLKAHIWPILFIFAFCDISAWVLARVNSRIVNEVALRLLDTDRYQIGSLWFMSPNPDYRSYTHGYKIIMYVCTLLSLPLTLLTKTLGSSAVVLLCCKHTNKSGADESVQATALSEASLPPDFSPAQVTETADQPGSTEKPVKKGRFAIVHHVMSTILLVQPGVAAVWQRAFNTDVVVALRLLPLQFLSTLVLPLPWTLPRLLDLQAANPVATLDGLEGEEAMARAKELVRPLRAAVALPFLGLMFLTNAMEPLKGQVLASMPVRWYRELPEIPIVVFIAFSLLTLVIQRLHNLLPIVIYQQGQQHDTQPAA